MGEINARFTRCYVNRIYVFVNPPRRRIVITSLALARRSVTFSPRFLSAKIERDNEISIGVQRNYLKERNYPAVHYPWQHGSRAQSTHFSKHCES